MPKVSIIIPVYNVEKYLRESIDSLINQTLSDIEIICIDDGSTDNSFTILEEYAKKDERIKILKQQNQGAGIARNNGLKIATGEYLLFLDSDDIYSTDIALLPYNYAKEKNADIVFWNYAKQNVKTNEINHIKCAPNLKEDINYSVNSEDFSFHNTNPAPWSKLFKKSFIDKNNLTFQDLTSCNDIAFTWKSLALAKSVYYLDKELITYRIEQGEAISSQRYKKANNIIEAAKEIRNLLTKLNNRIIIECFYICIVSSFTYEFNQFPKDVNSSTYVKELFKFLPNKYKKGLKKCLKKKCYKKEYFKQKSLFSIENSNDKNQKIITVFGIKLKFKQKRITNAILVTGGAGFIGSHTVDKLIKENKNIIVVDKNKSKFINPRAKNYFMDINSKKLENIFKKHEIKQIIHLAAQTSVNYSNKYPVEDAQNNIIASIKLIELAKKYKIEKFITASTAAVYANPKYLPVDENHPLESISPYGISKHAMEEYLKISKLDYIICRFSNVFGPRQNCEGEAGVVAIFTDKMLKNQEIEIHGNGNQTRDFIYVEDIANILVKLIDSDIENEIINISTNTRKTINELYEVLKKETNYNLQPNYTENRIGDIKDSVLDNTKLCNSLNNNSFTSLERGLVDTVNYLKEIKNGK